MATADVAFVIAPGPVQTYVTPLVVEVPVKITLVFVQVNDPLAVAVTPAGVPKSCVTTTLTLVEQPVDVFVTVKV